MGRLGIDLTRAEYDQHLANMQAGDRDPQRALRDVAATLPGRVWTVELTEPTAKYGTAPNGRPYRSKWERDYAAHLDHLQRTQTITRWRYEEVTLLIGHDVRYTPDFWIETVHGIEVHEVKGYFRDDAKAKFRVAAMAWPCFRFKAMSKRNGRWTVVEGHNG